MTTRGKVKCSIIQPDIISADSPSHRRGNAFTFRGGKGEGFDVSREMAARPIAQTFNADELQHSEA
jgi:hypothetical protein